MAVAFGTTKSFAPATYAGSPVSSSAWAISGSNLVIVVYIGLSAATEVVNSVVWNSGSGTPVEIGARRDGGTAYISVWAIPAPVAATDTFTVALSGNVPYQISADYFTGADQTTPCPIADMDNLGILNGVATTMTPANVGASDAMAANLTHTLAGDSHGWTTGSLSYESNSTAVNMLTGYRTGASPMVSAEITGGAAVAGYVAVRIKAAGGAPAGPPVAVPILGYGALGC